MNELEISYHGGINVQDLQVTVRRADGLPIPKEEHKLIAQAVEQMFHKGYKDGYGDGFDGNEYCGQSANCSVEYAENISFEPFEMLKLLNSAYTSAYMDGFIDGKKQYMQARNVLCGR